MQKKEKTKKVIRGSDSVAEAVRVCKPKVIASYPITPQTIIVERLAEMVANGEIEGEFINVESEHSALSVLIGASAVGARTYTATTSQGLALMHEVLFNASGMRLPIVMTAVNRALSAPLNIWNDYQDSVAQKDTGWIQLYAEDSQEVADLTIQAYKIAENKKVLLPVMVCMDAFILTHTYEPVEIFDQELVSAFLPPFKPDVVLDPKNPKTFGAYADPNFYTEFRYMQQMAMENAIKEIKKVAMEFKETFGRYYGDLIDTYPLENAEFEDSEVILITMGSLVGTIKDTIDELREDGIKVGLLKIRALRPFPKEEIYSALKNINKIAVLEKDVSIGLNEGTLFTEIKSALYGESKNITGFILGLGGRDIPKDTIKDIVSLVQRAKDLKEDKETHWIDLRRELL
ncbi:MAG TPA: pyruvate ferredoxin oxidoreductase [Methanosarcinales archaeon]|nr:pyruvate ferredoxin oxidoreductase [Methanosarcinales archaeon]